MASSYISRSLHCWFKSSSFYAWPCFYCCCSEMTSSKAMFSSTISFNVIMPFFYSYSLILSSLCCSKLSLSASSRRRCSSAIVFYSSSSSFITTRLSFSWEGYLDFSIMDLDFCMISLQLITGCLLVFFLIYIEPFLYVTVYFYRSRSITCFSRST